MFQSQVGEKSLCSETHERCLVWYLHTVCFVALSCLSTGARSSGVIRERILAAIVLNKCEARGLVRVTKSLSI